MSVIQPNETITIALSVKDRHASAAWYKDMFGFETLYHAHDAGWSEIATNSPGVTIGFGEQDTPNPGNAVPVFGVSDFHDAKAKLSAAGVRFDGDVVEMEGMVRTETLYDPDGNALMIAEDLTTG